MQIHIPREHFLNYCFGYFSTESVEGPLCKLRKADNFFATEAFLVHDSVGLGVCMSTHQCHGGSFGHTKSTFSTVCVVTQSDSLMTAQSWTTPLPLNTSMKVCFNIFVPSTDELDHKNPLLSGSPHCYRITNIWKEMK